MCLKFTLLLTRITTSCNGRAPENRLPCSPTSHPPSVHFLATNTIKLITTEIGQNVFSIVANVPLMLHRLPLILVLTFSLIAGATSREKWEGGKAACLDGGALGVSWSVKQRSWTSLGTLWSCITQLCSQVGRPGREATSLLSIKTLVYKKKRFKVSWVFKFSKCSEFMGGRRCDWPQILQGVNLFILLSSPRLFKTENYFPIKKSKVEAYFCEILCNHFKFDYLVCKPTFLPSLSQEESLFSWGHITWWCKIKKRIEVVGLAPKGIQLMPKNSLGSEGKIHQQ